MKSMTSAMACSHFLFKVCCIRCPGFYHDLISAQTPNRYLETNDIPPHRNRTLSDKVAYSPNRRYTLQWLNQDVNLAELNLDNRDAAFKKYTRKPKPSDLLLHYNYGAAAVKWWATGTEVLYKKFKPPRPRTPVPAPPGPSKVKHNRRIAIDQCDEAREGGMTGRCGTTRKGSITGKRDTVRATNKDRHGAAPADHEFSPAGAGSGEQEMGEQAMYDEDDVMLFFWGNSQAAKERHSKKVQENGQRMERWRKGLPYV